MTQQPLTFYSVSSDEMWALGRCVKSPKAISDVSLTGFSPCSYEEDLKSPVFCKNKKIYKADLNISDNLWFNVTSSMSYWFDYSSHAFKENYMACFLWFEKMLW